MSFLDTFLQMLVILFAIAAGYVANRLGYLDSAVNQKVTKLILNLTMPATILAAVLTSASLPSLSELGSVLAVIGLFYGLELAAALLLPNLLGGTPAQKGVWRFGLMFSNVGFIGIPVASALLGQDAIFYVVLLATPFNLLSYSMGPLLLCRARRFQWKQFCTPCVIAAFAALLLVLFQVRLPAIFGSCLDLVGRITAPLSLLVIGSLLAGLPLGRSLLSPRLWIMAAFRLLLLPVGLFFLLGLIEVPPLVQGVAIILMAMPIATNGSLLSLEYGGDTETMAQITFLTTMASILTIPLLTSLLF